MRLRPRSDKWAKTWRRPGLELAHAAEIAVGPGLEHEYVQLVGRHAIAGFLQDDRERSIDVPAHLAKPIQTVQPDRDVDIGAFVP